MFELIVIVIVIALVAVLSTPKNKNQSNQSSGSYDRGYWAGRRDLRQEVMELIAGKHSVNASEIQLQIDKNQWFEDGSQASSINTQPVVSPDQQTSAAATASVETPIQKLPQKPIDYSIGLLYLGAFLFISAASLFVLLSGVSGVVKTAVVIGVSAAFYITGFTLNKSSKRLIEVGSTFAAIGLMLAPLSGVAVYGYWLNQSHGTAVWLGTSIVCTLLYSHALFKLRSQYIGYLFVGVIISLVESGFSQFGLGSYYMAWGLMLAALVSLVLGRIFKDHQINSVVELPFQISAIILVPLSLIWSLALLPVHGTIQLIFSLYFTAFYYALYGWVLGSGLSRQAYLFVSQIALVASTSVLLNELTASRFVVSCFFAIATLLYLIISFVKYLKQLIPRHFEGFMAMSVGLFIASIIGFADLPIWLFTVLFVGFVMFWIQWIQTKSIYSALIAQLSLVSLPAVLSWYVLSGNIDNFWLSLCYLLMATTFSAISYLITHENKEIKLLLIGSYITLATTGLLISFSAGGYAIALASVFIAMLTYVASNRHRLPGLFVLGHAFLYVAIMAVVLEAKLSVLILGLTWVALSICIYVSQFALKDKTLAQIFRYSASAGLVLVTLTGLTSTTNWYLGPISLLLLASTIFYESIVQRTYNLKEFSAATLMLALQWTIYKVGITDEFLIYSHLWAMLLLGLGLIRLNRREKTLFESYLKLALGVITIPFALILLNGINLGYGWIFIAEHILITFFGVIFKKAYVVWWGLVSTVLAVLYELRDLQFIALGILSLFVIGVAIYLSLKHQKQIGQ